ncbi:MAG TPA: hypothetical protein VHB72_04730 [Candidatus Saccharimonadales bacterium]|nr:hypothetical protein [Candidatus Saccharimonadales bacterium]
MAVYKQAPLSVRVMYSSFGVALILFLIFIVSNRSSGTAGQDRMSQVSLGVMLLVLIFTAALYISYLLSLFLSIINSLTWLNRGGVYFWTSAAVFFGDIAMFAYIWTH